MSPYFATLNIENRNNITLLTKYREINLTYKYLFT